MVNKQYKIHHISGPNQTYNSNGNSIGNAATGSDKSSPSSQKFNIGITKHYSPPVIRNSTKITNIPNPYDSPTSTTSSSGSFKNHQQHQNHNINNQHTNNHRRTSSYGNKSLESFKIINGTPNITGNVANNIENTFEQLIIDDKSINDNSNFGRNIALSYDTVSLASETYHKIGGQRQFDVKDISINDIGRFQYIVQMDKEMDSKFYNQPTTGLSSKSSSTLEDRSSVSNHSLSFKNFQTDKINFWKTDTTKYNFTKSRTTTLKERTCRILNWRKNELKNHLRSCWEYSKWPILLLLSCLVLGSLIYVLYLGSYVEPNSSSKNNYMITESSNFINTNHLNYTEENETITNNEDDDDLLKKFIITNKIAATSEDIITTSMKNIEIASFENNLNIKDSDKEINSSNETEKTEQSLLTTTKTTNRNTKLLKFVTKESELENAETIESFSNQNSNKTPEKTKLFPVKASIKPYSFGHENNDRAPPVEEDEILKLFNEELMKFLSPEQNTKTEKPPPTSTLKVSPTLPVIIHHKDTSPGIKSTTESILNNSNGINDINVCQSTSLDICQGVLQYDLTTTKSKKIAETIDLTHFKYLIASNCSNRAAEFLCSYLEPECRSNGSLEPCKRICKSILEPCSSIIASSEILTMIFDCDRYPDSSDRNVCEDPTRRSNSGKCYYNEFQCLDSTCIPKQWKCDNIKDCSLGEEEENCKFCHHEEFRCRSDDSCITGNLQCDGYEDCADGSDEYDCFDQYEPPDTDDDDYDDNNDNDNINKSDNDSNYDDNDYPMPRIYSFASIQSPNNPDSLPFFAIPIDENGKGNKMIEETSNRGGGLFDQDNSSIDLVDLNDENINKNKTKINEKGKPEKLSKSLANFQDSTEIMMTSDSEYDFKYSKYRTNRTSNAVAMAKRVTGTSFLSNFKRSAVKTTTTTTTTAGTPTTTTTTKKPTTRKIKQSTEASVTTTKKNIILMPEIFSEPVQYCPEGKLRCITGECITVDQLCDRQIDCPDGADEARCIYKDKISEQKLVKS